MSDDIRNTYHYWVGRGASAHAVIVKATNKADAARKVQKLEEDPRAEMTLKKIVAGAGVN